MTLAGDMVRRLTSTPDYEETGAAVSPSGAMIAYVATRVGDSFSHVWMMNRDGSSARRVLREVRRIGGLGPQFFARPAQSRSPSWTPDSKFVLVGWSIDAYLRSDGQAYEANGELYAVRVADGLAIRLTRNPNIDAQPVFR